MSAGADRRGSGEAHPGSPAARPAVILGVLNVTPDSFSDGGRFAGTDAAIDRGRELAAQGAQIVDVGGESTRPGAAPVPRAEELARVLPVIEALAAEGIRVSVDTLHATTAAAAIAAGAQIVNDVSGGTHDPELLSVVAGSGAELVLGHWRGVPDPAGRRSDYIDVVAEVRDALAARAADALSAGIDPARIVLDPGLGFDKTGAQGFALLRRIEALHRLGHRVLVGASRKRMIRDALAPLPHGEGQVDLASAVVSALAARAGVWGVRVHDVPASLAALAIAAAWGAPEAGVPPAPRDRIRLTGLEAVAHHGVFGFERERGQRFVVDAELVVDLRAAAESDELGRTVDYGVLATALLTAVERDPVDLIETVAERAMTVALGFPGVAGARITVHKPDAPIDARFADVSVTLQRGAGAPS